MSDRKEDFTSINYTGFGGDEYNLQTGIVEASDSTYNTFLDDNNPKVLTTMRNMFSERKSDDYELVYHNFSENHPIPTRNTQNLNQYYPESHLNQQIAQNQHVYRIIHHNPHPIRQIQHFVPNPQPGPPEVKEEDDYEEEDHDEDDFMEDNRIVHHCPECSKKYTSERRLKHHIEVHKNANAYKCPKCGYCYQSPDSLRRHWKKTPNCDETLPKSMKAESMEPTPQE
ncbi:hypothetical protein GCK72_003510 [Caenorhabditis remanei]|uniref:C2H2-type domain-containing protein n=1 Tax=Caenorhabditis remanei TaxID=31234 RepID=A0A6A5HYC8_CAERE|nr:hypothetical protein GCK72_003510 [Caenorhabditis remanei]KAF1771683.1 hypothetical protein GCK72_003510 [Caenorhabditis remanei]